MGKEEKPGEGLTLAQAIIVRLYDAYLIDGNVSDFEEVVERAIESIDRRDKRLEQVYREMKKSGLV